jgi:hypothetical protein
LSTGCQKFKDGGRGGEIFGGFSHWRTVLADFFNAKEFPAFFLILYLEKAFKLNDEMLLKEKKLMVVVNY